MGRKTDPHVLAVEYLSVVGDPFRSVRFHGWTGVKLMTMTVDWMI
jgi:hypothetical protein